MTTAKNAALITRALRLAGTSDADGTLVLPPARARRSIDRLLTEAPDDLTNTLTTLLDWDRVTPGATDDSQDAARYAELSARDGRSLDHDEKQELRRLKKALRRRHAKARPAPSRATKANLRRAEARLAGNGAMVSAHGLEVVSFAVVAGPLLGPDGTGRILTECRASNAYQPIRYPAATSVTLRRMLAHYPQARVETILMSLFATAHDGLWWERIGRTAPPGRRRRRRTGDRRTRAEAAIEAQLATTQVTARSRPFAQLCAEELSWSPQLVENLSTWNLTAAEIEAIRILLGDHREHATPVLASYLQDLPAELRPDNPIPLLVATLASQFAEENPREFLPEHPESWPDLYPEGSLTAYELPELLEELDFQTLPGTGVGDVEPAVVSLCRTEHALMTNRTYMGNCTGGWHSRSKNGTEFIGKVLHGEAVYNFSIHADGRIGEVNSRFNSGGVPERIRQGLESLVSETRSSLS